MDLLKYHIYRLLFMTSLMFAPATVRAQVGLPEELRPEYLPDVGRDGTPEEKIYTLAGDVIVVAMQVVGGVAIIMLIITGIRYILAAGEEEKISKAKTSMFWIIGGLVLLFLALSIIRFVVKITLVTEEL